MKNNKFKIELTKTVGKLNFGIARKQVRAILGNYRVFDNVKCYDEFDICHTMYDMEDKLVFICFTTLENVDLFLNNENISKMAVSELLKYISNFSDKINILETSFVCDELGFAMFFEKVNPEKLKTICFTIKNFWTKHN